MGYSRLDQWRDNGLMCAGESRLAPTEDKITDTGSDILWIMPLLYNRSYGEVNPSTLLRTVAIQQI